MRFKKLLILLPLLAFCSSCSLQGQGGEMTIYNVRFGLATAGNCLNMNIYAPENGPIGFVSYKSFFSECYIDVDYDSVVHFSCTFTGGEKISKTGTYTAGIAQTGNVLTANYSNGETISYYWPNYFQFYATEIFNLPGLGPTSVTILYHAAYN
jgi:hypothetical protein